MSIIDKMIGAVTPPESDDARREATAKARSLSTAGDWLSMALDHHERIRTAFDACRRASSPAQRLSAMKTLAICLNGHALAEEIVLYPAMAKSGEKGHAGTAYAEQTTAKMQMAELERIDPTDEAWLDKVEHIRGAVLHHMFEEEGTWFPELKTEFDDQAFLSARFREEYERYTGDGQMRGPASRSPDEPRSFAPPSDDRTIGIS